jgi:hypothetical protein
MSTRKNQRKNRSTRRNRQSGGAPTDAELVAALMSVIIDEDDYERMVGYESSAIDNTKSYAEFVEWNKSCVKTQSDTDKFLFVLMAKRVKSGLIEMVDMETTNPWNASNLFFDTTKHFVFVHPR